MSAPSAIAPRPLTMNAIPIAPPILAPAIVNLEMGRRTMNDSVASRRSSPSAEAASINVPRREPPGCSERPSDP